MISIQHRLAQAFFGILFFFLLAAFGSIAVNAAEGTAPIRVILWFDTEDYLSPRDDDATKRLCELLTARNIRATFKLVGEKARVLESRKRTDVIRALKKHDIGYHANFHSVHPTPTEYLANCGWLDGVAEFARREGGGAADVRRILSVPQLVCYGQPGSSWAPQTIAALPQMGIAACYLDEGSHVGMPGKPFWYAGGINVYHMGDNVTRMDLHEPGGLEVGKEKFSKIAERLRTEGGGLISIFYHPCEWIHKEFWDGVNFSRGKNPPRELWQVPPQRSQAETDAAFERFTEYVEYMAKVPGVQWITASDLPRIYKDSLHVDGCSKAEVNELAQRIQKSSGSLDYQKIGKHIFSISDQFEVLVKAVDGSFTGGSSSFPVKVNGLLGPDASPTERSSELKISGYELRDAVRALNKFITVEHRVPARVFVGTEEFSPGSFLVTLASAWMTPNEERQELDKPNYLIPVNARIVPERHVAADTPGLFGGWIIHKENFRAPRVMELARLQAWTFKPAE